MAEHRRIALAYALYVVLALLLGGVGALWMRIELVSPAPSFGTPQQFNWMFTLHGSYTLYVVTPLALFGVAGHWLLPDMLGRERLAALPFAYAGLLAHLVGLALLMLPLLLGGSMSLSIAGAGLLRVALVVMTVPVLATRWAAGERPWLDSPFVLGLVLVAILQLIGALAGLVGTAADIGSLTALRFAPALTVLAGKALVLAVLVGDDTAALARARRPGAVALIGDALVIVLDGVATWLELEGLVEAGLVELLRLTFAGSLASLANLAYLFACVAALATRGRPHGPAGLLASAFIACMVMAWVVGAYLRGLSVDVHLADTYMIVGHTHLDVMAALFLALPAGVLTFMLPAEARMHPRWWWSAVPLSLGVPSFALAAFVLGHQGMPRRYYAYLPEYTPLQQAMTLAAFMIALGVLVWLVGVVRVLVTHARVKPGQTRALVPSSPT